MRPLARFKVHDAAFAAPKMPQPDELGDLRFRALMSVHGLDYYPDEPRLGVQYELLDMSEVDRITVKLRVPTTDPRVDSVTPDWPTASRRRRPTTPAELVLPG